MNDAQNGHEPPADLLDDAADATGMIAESLRAAYENHPLPHPSDELRRDLVAHFEELRPMPKHAPQATSGLTAFVPIIGGSLLAIVIASAIFMWSRPEPSSATGPTILVPVATRALPAGHVLRAIDLEQRPMTPKQLAQTLVPLEVMMVDIDQVVGLQLSKPQPANSPIATTSVYLGSGEPTYEVKPGHHVVDVDVALARGGHVKPGDVVDVYFTSNPRPADDGTGTLTMQQQTLSVANAVPVLEVQRPTASVQHVISGETVKDPSILLQVPPEQIAKFQALEGLGNFSLMIRSKDDVGIAKELTNGMTFEEAMGFEGQPQQSPTWAVEYYKRGSRGAQYFPIPQPSPEQIAEYQKQYKHYQESLASADRSGRPLGLTQHLKGLEKETNDLLAVRDLSSSTTFGEEPKPSRSSTEYYVESRLERLSGLGLHNGRYIVPTSGPTSDLAANFSDSSFGVVEPAFGGFDKDKDVLVDGEWFERGRGGDQYARIYDNAFKTVSQDPLSTFSIDVDTASYSKMRQHILEHGQLPPPDAVRIEELLNYFPYDYLEPMDEHPFAAHMEVAQCPWNGEHRLARIAIKGKEMKSDERPASNLVFLVDVSGSMNEPKRLPLVVRGLEMLTRELGKNDRVAIVVYAGAAGLVLPSTLGDEQETILAALGKLSAGGSTAGAEGINLAYQTAAENFIHAGVNRVILCTDGDFNVGTSDTGSLVRLAEEQAKKNIFLSILGFGIGNLNDEMLEQVSNKANGMYAFIDTESEARKVLVEQLSGTLVTIAKDVKIQIEFNPAKVAAYRLIGYENRILAAEDFNDDKKDAGEIGAGHTVTALYEIVPVVAKEKPEVPTVDELKYQRPSELTDAAESDELLTLKLRYKSPEGDKSTLLSEPIDDSTQAFGKVSDDFKFAAAVASFGMLLRGSEYSGDATMDAVLEIATDGAEHDPWGYRKEFLEIVKRAKELKK